jgi:hypothetical protein
MNDTSNSEREQRLHAALHDDHPDLHADLAQRLAAWDAPRAAPALTAILIGRLEAELPSPKRARLSREMLRWAWMLIRSQVRVVRREIWAATLLVMALGTLVTLISSASISMPGLPIAIFAPIIAALGVAFLYDSESDALAELLDATPASVRLLLFARLTLVFGFNLIAALVASIALVILRAEISLWPLVASWLAPMAFLSALAFLLTMLTRDALAGALVSGLLWSVHLIFRAAPGMDPVLFLLSFPGLSAPDSRPLLLILAALLVAFALWLGGNSERRLGELR